MNPIMTHSLFSRTQRATFFNLALLLLALLWGCAPQGTVRQGETAPSPPESGAASSVRPAASNVPEIRVCLTTSAETGSLSFDGRYLLTLEEARYQIDRQSGSFQVFSRGGHLVLSSERRYFEVPPGQELAFEALDSQSRFVWNDTAYAGDFSVRLTEEKFLQVVNQLPIETYLNGVVPFEIPSTSEDGRAAVYAQAIAARSYAFFRLANSADTNFDLYASTRDQYYGGLARQTPLAQAAVAETRGMLLTQNERPALTQYHASSGGVLNVPEDQVLTHPGNRGRVVYDEKDNLPNDRISPYYRWVERRDAETILANLRRYFAIDSLTARKWLDSGFTINMDIARRTAAGRVEAVNLQIEDREFLLEGMRIRKVLGDANGKPLPSNLFFLKVSPNYPDRFFIIGAGAGHGRGMSQWGAVSLSQRGYSFQDILAFYYPDMELKKVSY
ncbi:MAG TPA: SpoIID/LytB domain-containing protein [Calditrichia bacterium]|nr:SpoIID/LytB domain-containing protein [Calditrichia bacterium]